MLGLGLLQDTRRAFSSIGDNTLFFKEVSPKVGFTDGINDYIDLGDLNDFTGTAMSISIWFNFIDKPTNGLLSMQIGDSSITTNGVQLYLTWDQSTFTPTGETSSVVHIFPKIYCFSGSGSSNATQSVTITHRRPPYSLSHNIPHLNFNESSQLPYQLGCNHWHCLQFRWGTTDNSGYPETRIVNNFRHDEQNTASSPYDNGDQHGWTRFGTAITSSKTVGGTKSVLGAYYAGSIGNAIAYDKAKWSNLGIWNKRLSDAEMNALAFGISPQDISSGSLKHHWDFNNDADDNGTASSRTDRDATLVNGAVTNETP